MESGGTMFFNPRGIPDALWALGSTFAAANFQAWIVGGAVRDLVMGRRPSDWDVGTDALPHQVEALFERTVATGAAWGTITVWSGELPVEVTTFRQEGNYRDRRRPTFVIYTTDINEDLARRDFTINAMAYPLATGTEPCSSGLLDPYGGVEDVRHGVIRAVGRAEDRYQEDALRMLRACRFASTLAFRVAPDDVEAIRRYAPLLGDVAVERVGQELRKLLQGAKPSAGLAVMQQTGLLEQVLPELHEPELHAHEQQAESLEIAAKRLDVLAPEKDEAVAAAALFLPLQESMAQVLRRLRYPERLVRRARHLARSVTSVLGEVPTGAELRRILARVGRAEVEPLLRLRRALLGRLQPDAAEVRIQEVITSQSPLSVSELAIDGRAVADLLGKQGPEVGRVLQWLLKVVLEEPDQNEKHILKALVKTHVALGSKPW